MWRFEGGLEIQSWGLGKERGGGNQYGVRNVYQRKQFTYQNQLRITQMSGGVKAQASPLILQVSPSVLGINPRNSTPEWHKFPGAGGTFLRICRPMTGKWGPVPRQVTGH